MEEWKAKYQQAVEEKNQWKQELEQLQLEITSVKKQDATIRELQRQLKQVEEDSKRKVRWMCRCCCGGCGFHSSRGMYSWKKSREHWKPNGTKR